MDLLNHMHLWNCTLNRDRSLTMRAFASAAVENLQGIHWQRVTIEGAANHAGTTPTALRHDAGLAAAKVNVFLRQLVEKSGGVATVGCIEFKPNAINVIPSKAVFTVDLRNPDKEKLDNDEKILAAYLKDLAKEDDVKISTERLTEFDPVPFDEGICRKSGKSSKSPWFKCKTHHFRRRAGCPDDRKDLPDSYDLCTKR